MDSTGFIVIQRKLLEWEWHDDPNTLALWIHILLITNWKPNRWHGIEIPRGSCLRSLGTLSEETGMTVQNIRTAITHLKSTGEITTKSTRYGLLINVINYAKYQYIPVEGNTVSNTIPNNELTGNQHGTNTELTTLEQSNNSNKETIIKKKEEITNVISKKEKPRFVPPTVEEVREYCDSRYSIVDPEAFVAFYESKNWMVGKNKMSNWKSAIITWEKKEQERRNNQQKPKQRNLLDDLPF